MRNVRTDEQYRFDALYELDGAWRLLGGIARSERRNSEPFFAESDNRLDTVEAGVRRDFLSGSWLALIARQGRGEYFNRPDLSFVDQFDDAFTQREEEIRAAWTLSAKSTLQGRLAYVERRHDHFPVRDYSGMVGNLSVVLRATDKLALTGNAGRELSAYQSAASSYASTDRLVLGASWRIAAKTTLRGQFEQAWRDFHGALADVPDSGRKDRLQNLRFALEWQPLRTLQVAAALEQERRDSNRSAYDFDDTTATVSAQFSF
ncbi:MAG: outer membrane beta-barrel protein [Propionivibrio sp.]